MEDKFIKFVAEIMGIDPSEISLRTEYNQFEKWDSIMMLTLIMELEAEYGKSIPMEKVGDIKTLSDLYEMVK